MFRVYIVFYLSFLLAILSSSSAFSQGGAISGYVHDHSTGEPLIDVQVMLPQLKLGAATELDGDYYIGNIPPGTYNVVFVYIGYKKDTAYNVVVAEGQTVRLDRKLKAASGNADIPQVIFYGQRNTTSEQAVLEEIKDEDNVVSGIGQSQIGKTQDRTAAEVVSRIPGVTIIDNRFIQIRGLNERYNTVWLNDATAPSSETDRKSFSFDIVPSSLIDRILVYKTISPELPGDFAGGLVKVYTRNAPESKGLILNYSTSGRVGTTFNNFQNDKSGVADVLGFGASSRNLNSDFPVINSRLSSRDKDKYASTLPNNWGLKSHSAIPDQRVNFTYNNYWNIKGYKFYNISAVNYSYTSTKFNIHRTFPDATGQANDVFLDKQYTSNARLGILQNFTFVTKRGDKFEFRNLFNQLGRNQTTFRQQYDVHGNEVQESYAIGYQSRTVYSGQLAGTHKFNREKTHVQWLTGYSISNKNEPDLRRLGYGISKDSLGNKQYTAAVISGGSPSPVGGSRLFQKLNENVQTLSLNVTQKIRIRRYNFEASAGTYLENKQRTFNARLFGYFYKDVNYFNNYLSHLPIGQIFDPANVGTTNGFTIGEDINHTYHYTGSNHLRAGYLSLSLPFGNIIDSVEKKRRFSLVGGTRYEYNLQSIDTRAYSGDPIHANVKTSMLLPSANLAYNINKKNLLRLAYGRSLNRPEFREWAPFSYYDFDFNVLNFGNLYLNPNNPLKVAAIDNFDLRYELYPSATETVNFGIFYKHFANPIETVVISTTNLAYSYANAKDGYIRGVELEIRKNLHNVDSLLNTSLFRKFGFLFNASVVQSKVHLKSDVVAWSRSRALQGQSPYVFNTGLFFTDDSTGIQATIQYNVFGPRIVIVGSDQYPDVIEMPRHTVDLSISKRISKAFSVNVGVQDLFNQAVVFVQDFNRDQKYDRHKDPQLMNFKRGQYITVGVRYSPF